MYLICGLGNPGINYKNIINSIGKQITGLSVVIELKELNAKSKFNFPVESQVIY